MAAAFVMNSRSPDPISRHRAQYKGTTPPWKETYRKRCMERLKNGRHKFLDRFRNISSSETCSGSSDTDSVTATVKDVMNDEWRKLRDEHQELPAWLPSKTSCSPFPGMQVDVTEELELDQILNVMEEIQQELLEEERAILAHYEESVQFEEASLCAAVECLRTEDVACPVCRRNPLIQNKQVIFCACGIRIDTEHDGINLSYVRTQIEEAMEMHSGEGCPSEPEFLVSSLTELPANNLLMLCKNCDFLYIIV